MATPTNKRSSKGPSVNWNEATQTWMAWVPFPDGTRKKIQRKDKAAAKADLQAALEQRAEFGERGTGRRKRATFHDVIVAWVDAGCPAPPDDRYGSRHVQIKGANTLGQINDRMAWVDVAFQKENSPPRPWIDKVAIGKLVVEQTTTARIEEIFKVMDERGLASDTVHRTWRFLHHACEFGIERHLINSSPVRLVRLPAKRTPKRRKSFTVEQVQSIIFKAIATDPRPAMWFTGLMCGLRPGEIAGLRWCYLDLDSDKPTLKVEERAHEEHKKYVGQRDPKGGRKSKRTILLHPLLAAALINHREEQKLLNLYQHTDAPFEASGFVFPTKNSTPLMINNLRRYFNEFCRRAGVGEDWTTYEMRHSFVTLASDQLDDLMKVTEVVGHLDERTTENYRQQAHDVRPALSGALEAWNRLLSDDNIVPIRSA